MLFGLSDSRYLEDIFIKISSAHTAAARQSVYSSPQPTAVTQALGRFHKQASRQFYFILFY